MLIIDFFNEYIKKFVVTESHHVADFFSAQIRPVDHSILLGMLGNNYGITEDVHKWFASYLTNRTYCGNVRNAFSDFICALFGVPQGSILGPILFIMYTKHLEHIALSHNLNIKLYADDSQLYLSFTPNGDDYSMFSDKVNACISDIKSWVELQFLSCCQ